MHKILLICLNTPTSSFSVNTQLRKLQHLLLLFYSGLKYKLILRVNVSKRNSYLLKVFKACGKVSFPFPRCESPLAEQLGGSKGVSGYKMKCMVDDEKITQQFHSILGMKGG